MDQPLRDQIRYLELRLRECASRPDMHKRQIAAYRQQLQLARAADSGVGYLRAMVATETMMAVARAEWIDRYRNWAGIYRALGDEVRTRTADENRRSAERHSGDAGLMTALIGVKARHAPVEHAADASASCLHNLLSALLDWRVAEGATNREELARAVRTLWATMRANDPACTWERVCAYPPYRNRLPFAQNKLAILGTWLEQVVGAEAHARAPEQRTADTHERAIWDGSIPASADADANADPPTVELTVPSAQQAAQAYHYTYDALDHSAPNVQPIRALYEEVFKLEEAAASGPAFLRAMAENDLYCRLARAPQLALARRGLARSKEHSQPHAEYHYRALEQAVLACHSPTEVEYEVERASRMFAVEVAWNDALLGVVARVLTAVSRYVAEPDDSLRAAVLGADRVVDEVLGRPWREIMATPRMWDMFCRVWFARGRSLEPARAGHPGAHFGELGNAAVSPVREATVQRLLEKSAEVHAAGGAHAEARLTEIRSNPLFDNPDEMFAYLCAGLRRAGIEDASDSSAAHATDDPPPLRLWGRPVALEHLHEELERPGRPAIVWD